VDMPGAKANDDGANGFSELFNAWATFEARRSDMAAAMAVLARGRQRYPKDASLHQTLGMLLKRSQDVDGARASFTRSLQIKEHAPTYVAFALLEAEQGHPERARDLFDKGAAADPSHVPLYSARAKFELSRGGVASARAVLEEAVVRYPSPTLWHGWGKLEERQGNLDKAAELYGKGARSGKGGDDPSYLWHSLGSVLLQQRQLPAALHAFEEGLSRRPSSSQLLLGAAIVHGQLGHHEKGRQMFLQAIQADPSHAHAWQAWGVMEARLGNVDVARDLYERGRRRCPDHSALWQASAKLEGESGQKGARSQPLQDGGRALPHPRRAAHCMGVLRGAPGS